MTMPTVIVAAIIAAVFLAIIFTGIRNRKKGKSSCSCGCSCSECAMSGACHSKE